MVGVIPWLDSIRHREAPASRRRADTRAPSAPTTNMHLSTRHRLHGIPETRWLGYCQVIALATPGQEAALLFLVILQLVAHTAYEFTQGGTSLLVGHNTQAVTEFLG